VTGPNLRKQKAAWAALDNLFAEARNIRIIHYSCESFYDRPNGRSPRITSIAVRDLDTAQTQSFSIHQVADERHVPFDEIAAHYDCLERQMLADFYKYIGQFQGMKYIHWNMRNINYGFHAIEHRYRVLGGDPVIISDDKKIDLARILIDIYGRDYISHPRLEELMVKNSIMFLDFLRGAQEAEAFDERNFVALHQSTLRKVDVLATIATLAHDRHLETKTTWWAMHGGRLRMVCNWIAENRMIAFAISIISLAVGIVGVLVIRS
jgi:hypothetical protein